MESRKYTRIFRIMHWAIAFTMLFILLTILLRLGWMEKVHVAEIAGDYLTEQDVELEQNQLIIMAKKIRKPMWEWHIYAGYLLMGLYALRMSLPFFGVHKFLNPMAQKPGKARIEAWTYIIFYVLVGASLVTGFLMVNGPEAWEHTLEEVHELSIYYFVAFIVLHFGGVLASEFGANKGIISRVISGEETGGR